MMKWPLLFAKHFIAPLFGVSILLTWFPFAVARDGEVILPQLRREVYAQPGDVNIGVILDLHEEVDESGCAGDIYPGSWAIEYPESVAFTVDLVNKDPKLMPNATLGFYLLDDCADRRYALAHALTFMPRNELVCKPEPCETTAPSNTTCIPSACSITPSSNASSLSSAYEEQPLPHYDVVGVLSPQISTLAISVSLLLSLASVPIIGYMTATDEFLNKDLHPTYLRVVTTEKHQSHAMLQFIFAEGWSYISVVYSHGKYGEGAFSDIKSLVGSFNICIATSHRVKENDDMAPVLVDLLHHPRARVVILFTHEDPALNLFELVETLDATGHFIWICSDAVTAAGKKTLSRYMSTIVGAFMFNDYTVQVPEFYDHIRRQNPLTSSNPWFKLAWEDTFRCSFANGTCNASADITKNPNFGFEGGPSLLMDAVLTFAHAIHDLLADRCPADTGQAARDCIKRDILLEYLFNVSFIGYTGTYKFNENQEYLGKYIIYQVAAGHLDAQDGTGKLYNTKTTHLVYKEVACFDSLIDKLYFMNETISWDHLVETERIVPLTVNTSTPDVPESVCSRPCLPGEYKIQSTPECCWECRKCRRNERLINEKTECEACKKFTWPDPKTNFTTCEDIPLSYIIATETIPLIEICLAVMGITGTLWVATNYYHHRNTRVIKAASKELSALQLSGIFLGYVTVILFQTPPTPTMCTTLYFMFSLSFSWLYSPLLVKAIRIYRIFSKGKKGRRPRFISPLSQVIIASLIIISQAILCFVMFILYHPTAVISQPVPTEKYVELSCDMTLPGLVSSLAYNLVFVCLSAVFAFKTRHLPSNFKESKFISMCVYTTLVIWMAFIPTYFTADRDYVKVLLLSAALLLNHTVALLFLFIPKIYAIAYVADEDFITDRSRTGQTERTNSTRRTMTEHASIDKGINSRRLIDEIWLADEPSTLNRVPGKNLENVQASRSFLQTASPVTIAVASQKLLTIQKTASRAEQLKTSENPSGVNRRPEGHFSASDVTSET